eukprot:scpid106699/ scgid30250/ 
MLLQCIRLVVAAVLVGISGVMACKENTGQICNDFVTSTYCRVSDGGESRAASESGYADASPAPGSGTGHAGHAAHVPEAVRRLRGLFVQDYLSATIDMGEGMVDEGLREPSVSDVHVRLMILSRPELQEEFRNASFDSTGDM